MRNQDIREYAKKNNIKLWLIAEKLGIADSSFSRILRYEITQKKRKEIFAIIDELAKEKERGE